MPTRAYSFRGSPSLGGDVRDAIAAWPQLLGDSSSDPDRVAEQWSSFAATLSHYLGALDLASESDSAVLRSCLEAFVAATVKATDDAQHVAAYAEWRHADVDAHADRAGALAAAAARWTDD